MLATGGAVGAQTAAPREADAATAAATASLGIQLDRVSRSGLRPAIASVDAEQDRRSKSAAKKRRARRAIAEAVRDPEGAARAELAEHGWAGQFGCLDALWSSESGWDPHASNPSSGAYGIPQALPGSKMASAGADWRTNPITQIRWGLDYIESTYGTPCGAASFKQGHGWY